MANPVAYFEIAGPNAAALAEFYRQLFGWDITPGPFPGYFNIASGESGAPNGGIRQEEKPERIVYVRVPDLDAAVAEVVRLGGRVLIPPTRIPGVVTFALFEDPAGNRTGMVHEARLNHP